LQNGKVGYTVPCSGREEKHMDREALLNRITVDPGILVGKPAIRGMRISVEQILDALAAGVPEQDLLEDTPTLEPDDIRAVLLYARDIVASERIYPIMGINSSATSAYTGRAGHASVLNMYCVSQRPLCMKGLLHLTC
jgi:uncharacterized protein (DUF433 family)